MLGGAVIWAKTSGKSGDALYLGEWIAIEMARATGLHISWYREQLSLLEPSHILVGFAEASFTSSSNTDSEVACMEK